MQEALGSMPSTAKFLRQLFLIDLKIEKHRRKRSFEAERSAQQPSDKEMELSYHRHSGRDGGSQGEFLFLLSAPLKKKK